MSNTDISWTYIADQINRKKCTPVISNQLILSSLYPAENVATEWAKSAAYPLADSDNIALVAQYLSVTYRDNYRAKTEYLQFLKQRYLAAAEQDTSINATVLDQVRRERGLSLSQLAGERLGYPPAGEQENALNLLAAFDMPIYLTTTPHLFLEIALRNLGKRPRTEVYAWHEALEEVIPPEYKTDPDFQPSADEPLVYHLHGLDEFPDSLVLTEEDHLDFLGNVIHDFREIGKMPNAVRNAISSSILILLGYNVRSWEMRVILQELIRDQPRRPRSVAIQLDPHDTPDIIDTDRFQEYMQMYLAQDKYRFDVYWGDALSFLKQLWETWQGT